MEYIPYLFSEANMFMFHLDPSNDVFMDIRKCKYFSYIYFFHLNTLLMQIGIPIIILLFQTDSNVG